MKTSWYVMMVIGAVSSSAWRQSSSLYVKGTAPKPERPVSAMDEPRRQLSPVVAQQSFTAVVLPEPRRFAMHDLVTIIVREATESDSDAKLKTEKDTELKGEISEFPHFDLLKLLQMQLKAGNPADNPKVGIKMNKDFDGSGDYSRKDTFTSRITARIMDIKPNGTLVLEARKFIQSDDETLDMVLTGTCRKGDVTPDNTILSTQLYDLRLNKKHEGELHDAAKKGILTTFFETLFAF